MEQNKISTEKHKDEFYQVQKCIKTGKKTTKNNQTLLPKIMYNSCLFTFTHGCLTDNLKF